VTERPSTSGRSGQAAPAPSRSRAWRANALLLVAATLISYALLEVVGFRLALPHVPLKLQVFLPEGIRFLGQSSKRGAVPEHYIALVGDSYAKGFGDWLLGCDANRNPAFNSAHLIHERTGRDVVTFGASGAGSLRGIVTEPIAQLSYVNASLLYSVRAPDVFLVYFYSGNDLNDNLQDLRLRFDPQYTRERREDPGAFREFLTDTVVGGSALYREAAAGLPLADNLFLLRFVRNAMLGRGLVRRHGQAAPRMTSAGRVTRAVVGGRERFLPDGLQSPGLELSDEEVRTALFVFEQALLYLKQRFPTSAIGVVYVPSPLECYALSSAEVDVQIYEGRASRYPAAAVRARGEALAGSVRAVAARSGLGMVDATPFLEEAAGRVLVHGPRDWKHFNRRGYEALAAAALRLLAGTVADPARAASSAPR
jgi:hypothetical protein